MKNEKYVSELLNITKSVNSGRICFRCGKESGLLLKDRVAKYCHFCGLNLSVMFSSGNEPAVLVNEKIQKPLSFTILHKADPEKQKGIVHEDILEEQSEPPSVQSILAGILAKANIICKSCRVKHPASMVREGNCTFCNNKGRDDLECYIPIKDKTMKSCFYITYKNFQKLPADLVDKDLFLTDKFKTFEHDWTEYKYESDDIMDKSKKVSFPIEWKQCKGCLEYIRTNKPSLDNCVVHGSKKKFKNVTCGNCNSLFRSQNGKGKVCFRCEIEPQSNFSGSELFPVDVNFKPNGAAIYVDENLISYGEFVKLGDKVYLLFNKHCVKWLPNRIVSNVDKNTHISFDVSKAIQAPEHIDMAVFEVSKDLPSVFNSVIYDLDVSFRCGQDFTGAHISVMRNEGWFISPTQRIGKLDNRRSIVPYSTNTRKGDCGRGVFFKGILLGIHSGSWATDDWNVFVALSPVVESWIKHL